MTSYQNVAESEIRGYNDCPIDLPVASKTSKPRRVRHLSTSTTSSTPTSTSTSTTTTPPLTRPPSTKRVPSVSTTPAATTTHEEITDEQLTHVIDQLFSHETTLPEREYEHYGRKLRDSATKMKQPHRAFVLSCVENYKNKEQAKNTLVKFMMSNDGTSSWTVPLKKLLEGVKLE